MAAKEMDGLSDAQKYLFDLNGYLVLKGVLSPEEVATANRAVDKRQEQLQERKGALRLSGSDALGGDGTTGRADMGGMLEWEAADGDPFRAMLAHPRLTPVLNQLVGVGHRMDHLPLLISQSQGAEGFKFHGGATQSDGSWAFDLAYQVRNGAIHNALLAVSLVLTPVAEGDGGFAIVPGSHKANFPCPDAMLCYEEHKQFVRNPALDPGDVLLFTEAATHGTLAWTAEHQRRVVIYRFAPANMAYGRAYHPTWPRAMMERATAAQRAVLEPPYHLRLDRPAPATTEHGDGAEVVTPMQRADFKIEHDSKVFGTKYF